MAIELTLSDIFILCDGRPVPKKGVRPSLAAWWELQGQYNVYPTY